MQEYIHYELTQTEKRKIYNSSGNFYSSALCFNGSAHNELTNIVNKVSCPECRHIMSNRASVIGAVRSFIYSLSLENEVDYEG